MQDRNLKFSKIHLLSLTLTESILKFKWCLLFEEMVHIILYASQYNMCHVVSGL